MNAHNSDSSAQRKIEDIVLDRLQERFACNVKSSLLVVDKIKFQIDFWNEEKTIYGELYAGIDEVKAGQKRKVATDVLKLLTLEKLLGYEIKKYMIFTDNTVKKALENDSWLAKTFKEFNIEILMVSLTSSQRKTLRKTLRKTKEKQGARFRNQ